MIFPYIKLKNLGLEDTILQIYGDIVEDFRWTGEITFGLSIPLPNDVEQYVKEIYDPHRPIVEMEEEVNERVSDPYRAEAQDFILRQRRRDQACED